MVAIRTSEEILTDIKDRAKLPATQSTFSDADLFQYCNRELQTYMMTFITRYHEDYYVKQVTIPLVANQYRYRIPRVSFASKIRHIAMMDGNNVVTQMSKIEPSRRDQYSRSGNIPLGFYLEGQFIQLVPEEGTWNTTNSIQLMVETKPSQLVDEDRGATIASFTATQIVLAADFVDGTIDATDDFDIISRHSPFDLLEWDLNATTKSTVTLTFPAATLDASVNSRVQVGDYVCVAGESIIPNIPEELNDLLIERVVWKLHLAMGNERRAAQSQQAILDIQESADRMLDDREQSKPSRIIDHNSILRRGRSRTGWRNYQ